MTSSFVYQLIDDLALYNLNSCLFNGYQIGLSLYSSLASLLSLNLWDTFLGLSVALHRAPYTYNQCLELTATRDELLERVLWASFQDPVTSAINYGLNLALNGVDIYQEVATAYNRAAQGDWEGLGRYMGKVVADVVGKSPLAETWSHLNSESIKGEKLTPAKYNVKKGMRLTSKQESISARLAECLRTTESVEFVQKAEGSIKEWDEGRVR